jgi:plasmid replication initiation protein
MLANNILIGFFFSQQKSEKENTTTQEKQLALYILCVFAVVEENLFKASLLGTNNQKKSKQFVLLTVYIALECLYSVCCLQCGCK